MARTLKAVSDLENSLEYLNIKNDLLNQLDCLKIKGKHYSDLVEDYMSLWITKNLLVQDIKSRGVSIRWNNGGGQKGRKKNDSVSELTKVNAQMLKLLNDLGLKPADSTIKNVDDEDDELLNKDT